MTDTTLLKKAREELQQAEASFDDDTEEGTNLAFVALLDAITYIQEFLIKNTKH